MIFTPSSDSAEAGGNNIIINIPILRIIFWLIIASSIILAVIPSLYLFVWAFWGSETVGVLNHTPSMQWFHDMLTNSEWNKSLLYSCTLGFFVSILSTILLIVHFYHMRYVNYQFDRIAYLNIIILVMIPQIIYAISLRFMGGMLAIHETALVIIGHIIYIIPLQFFIFESAQETIPDETLFAGSTLGASHIRNICFNYIPVIKTTIGVAILIGFLFSFDEVVISTFVIDSSNVTVPRRLWDQIHRSMIPYPAVTSSLLIGFLLLCGILVSFKRLIIKSNK